MLWIHFRTKSEVWEQHWFVFPLMTAVWCPSMDRCSN